jgi:hypothetical protein
MFQFSAFASRFLRMIRLQRTGLPHSDISGSKVICTSPKLFAAYHVLHSLWEPRHPPCALINFLNYSYSKLYSICTLLPEDYHRQLLHHLIFIIVSLLPTCQRTYPISDCRLPIADFIPLRKPDPKISLCQITDSNRSLPNSTRVNSPLLSWFNCKYLKNFCIHNNVLRFVFIRNSTFVIRN